MEQFLIVSRSGDQTIIPRQYTPMCRARKETIITGFANQIIVHVIRPTIQYNTPVRVRAVVLVVGDNNFNSDCSAVLFRVVLAQGDSSGDVLAV